MVAMTRHHRFCAYVYFLCEICELCNLKINYYYYYYYFYYYYYCCCYYYYYTNDGGSCYGILLDASKAFGTVNYIKLFQLLSRKGICPVVSRFLAQFYTCQECSVRWGNHSSELVYIY